MPANECVPLKSPGLTITGQATGTSRGKRFCKISAPRVGGGLTGGTSQVTTSFPGSGANLLSTDTVDAYQIIECSVSGEIVLGVLGWDLAVGALGTIYKHGVGHILPVVCGANITAGQEVQTDAQGRAIPLAAGKAVGYALDSASSGADCEILVY